MNIELIGMTTQTIGEVLVGVTALAVHHRVRVEKSINKSVHREMKRETLWGILGVVLIILGYSIQVLAKQNVI